MIKNAITQTMKNRANATHFVLAQGRLRQSRKKHKLIFKSLNLVYKLTSD